MTRRMLSTVELARAARVPLSSLQFWIKSGKIAAPPVRLVDGKAIRHWSDADVEKVRKMKGALKRGPKGPRKKARRVSLEEISTADLASLLRKWKEDHRLVHWRTYFRGVNASGIGRVERCEDSSARIDARSLRGQGELDGCILQLENGRFLLFGPETAPPELGMPPGTYDISIEGRFGTGGVCHLFSVRSRAEIEAGLR